METSPASHERRKHPRFTLKAYGLNHHSTLFHGGGREQVLLVDITPAGARLRFNGSAHPPASGQTVVVDLQLPQISPPGLGLDSRVQWNDQQECGVQFLQELECGVSELQNLLDRAART